MREVYDAYIAHIRAVNEARTVEEHRAAEERLAGFRACLWARCKNEADRGAWIMAGDNYYLCQGVDRPMCGGEFLDWEPADDDRPR